MATLTDPLLDRFADFPSDNGIGTETIRALTASALMTDPPTPMS